MNTVLNGMYGAISSGRIACVLPQCLHFTRNILIFVPLPVRSPCRHQVASFVITMPDTATFPMTTVAFQPKYIQRLGVIDV